MNTLNLTRRQKLVLVAAAATLFLFLIARIVNNLAARDLVLNITPSGATVKIDNEVRSGTSFRLDATSHDLSVTKEGYLPKNTIITITKGKTTTLTINLVKKTPASLTEYLFRDAIYPDNPKQDIKVLTSKELYGGAWILGTVRIAGAEKRVVLLQQDTSSDTKYVLYLVGPPFNQSKFKLLPADVQSEINTLSVGAGD